MPVYRAHDPHVGAPQEREWRRRVARTVGLLAGTWAVCMVGLALFDESSTTFADRAARAVWNAANLISTLGDFTSLSYVEKSFIVVTMFAFMMIGGYAITRLTGLLSSPDVIARRENRGMERTLAQLAQHVIVVGYGPIGRQVAERLRRAGDTVVVIDRTEELATSASEAGYLAVRGDVGADDGVIVHARVASARALVITTEDPDRRLVITLMARAANPELRIAAIGANNRRGELLHRAGATDVVIGDDLIAAEIASRLAEPRD